MAKSTVELRHDALLCLNQTKATLVKRLPNINEPQHEILDATIQYIKSPGTMQPSQLQNWLIKTNKALQEADKYNRCVNGMIVGLCAGACGSIATGVLAMATDVAHNLYTEFALMRSKWAILLAGISGLAVSGIGVIIGHFIGRYTSSNHYPELTRFINDPANFPSNPR